ncbi:MAG: MFS transporter, partial [Sporomusa sp.]
KPILLAGLLLYSMASGLCAISGTINQLIIFRIAQAFGAGSVIAVSLALVKDCFEGKTRAIVLALVQGMSVIAPMVAPILGAFILQLASWRETFWVLAILGILNLMTGILFQETLPVKDRYQGSISGSLSRLLVVSKNAGFTSMLIIFSLFMAPYMAYVAISSYVYISYFHLSAQSYSYFFAVNSLFAILGPVVYLRLIHKVTPKIFTQTCFAIALISGLCLMAAGAYSPCLFLVAFLPFTLVESAIRPLSTSILLDQQEKDTGSASSLINAVNTIFGSIGMLLGTMNWSNIIEGLGILVTATAVLAIIVWHILIKSEILVKGLSVTNSPVTSENRADARH